ncbi:retrovirus-related pol polyprotein from transposon TNT 1-94 [Tanacetum coccineum]
MAAAEVPQTLKYRGGQLNVASVLEVGKYSPTRKRSVRPQSLDEEEVSSDDNEIVEVKVLMALTEENNAINKKGSRNGEWVKISMRKEQHSLGNERIKMKRKTYLDYLCIDLNYVEEQRNNLLSIHRDLVHELNACKEQLLVFKQAKLDFLTMQHVNTEILKEHKNLRTELKELTAITETWLNTSKVNSAPAGKLKSVKIKDDPLLAIVMKELNELKLQISKNQSSYSRSKALQAKKAEALKSTMAESSNANRSKTPTKRKPICYLDSGCSRHMNSVKSYLHKYVEQPGPKVVFGDDSTCTTKGYGSIKCNGIVFTKVAFVNGLKYNLIIINQLCDAKYIVQFDEKRGTIFNSNKEVVMIAPRLRDVYVLDMTSSVQESCYFAKASNNLNWLWHKRLAHLNIKTINKLAKQNLVDYAEALNVSFLDYFRYCGMDMSTCLASDTLSRHSL